MAGRRVYILSSFQNGRTLGDGLRLLASHDGRQWSAVPEKLLPLSRTGGRVFRDPSLLWHGAMFHLVWTSDLCVGQRKGVWKCERLGPKGRPLPRFGYARSADLVTWEGVRLVDVPLRGACSLWAPELTALPSDEGGGFMLVFSATRVADGRCPVNFQATAHRSYVMTSHDLVRFSAPRPLQLTGVHESVIDLYPMLNPTPLAPHARATGPAAAPRRHILWYKSEARREHNSMQKRSPSQHGPLATDYAPHPMYHRLRVRM